MMTIVTPENYIGKLHSRNRVQVKYPDPEQTVVSTNTLAVLASN
jgi:hypothetical protein